jgi:hypothetical protein
MTKKTQHEAVRMAMEGLGGYATLGQLYERAMKVPGVDWGTQTPFASIRRIVQQRKEYFFKIRPGLWGLVAQKNRILNDLNLGEHSTLEQKSQSDHYYYQGLLVETGKLKSHRTFVPAQDRGRLFFNSTLGQVITLKELPRFTYEHLIRRASSIDVVWMNDRDFPHAFFEVEHTTDMQNSLLKFMEFQDFYVKFFIVADSIRETALKNKLAQTAFRNIASRVKFMSYEKTSSLYEKELAVAQIRQETGI